jgi:glycosyltransferase involved in cell wall biosynthesis
MKILFLTDNFPPEVNAPANRTYEHCIEWVKAGAEVTVITCFPNFPKGKVYDGYKNSWKKSEIISGIRVIRVWSYITANEGFAKRILDYISYAITAFIAGLFLKTDIIIATSPQFFTAVSGASLAFFKRKKWIMEVRDLWPESIVAVGAMKKGPAIVFFEWLEINLYKSASHIIVVTDTFKEKISSRGIDSDKISVYKNGANLELYQAKEKENSLLVKHNIPTDKTIVGYIGTHGMAHGLKFILKTIEIIEKQTDELFFIFIGDGAEKNNLKKMAKEIQLKNVLFLDSVSKKEVVDYLNLIDIALVNLKKSDTFHTVIPSKIFEAAAMKKPILLGLEGETKKIIEQYSSGICFEPENSEDFIAKLMKLSTDKHFYQNCQLGCNKLAQDFDRKKIAANMLNTVQLINRN